MVMFTAVLAILHEELLLICCFEVRGVSFIQERGRYLSILIWRSHFHSLSMMSVALACLDPNCPPVPCASATSQFLTCTFGCASPRSCRTASMIFVMPPRLLGWLLHSPPPSVLTG